MFLIITLSLSITLIILFLRDIRLGKKDSKNMEFGWKITPYINFSISNFENRMDLEKTRLYQLIKNTLPLEKDIIFIESSDEIFYLKNSDELFLIEISVANDLGNYAKKDQNKKFEVNSIYESLISLLNNFVWILSEEKVSSLESVIYLKFKTGYIKLNISRVDEFIPLKKFDNDSLKSWDLVRNKDLYSKFRFIFKDKYKGSFVFIFFICKNI